jgi:hypothetical protein
VLRHFNQEKSWPGTMAAYDNSKLMVQYAFEEIARRGLGPDGRYGNSVLASYVSLPLRHVLTGPPGPR